MIKCSKTSRAVDIEMKDSLREVVTDLCEIIAGVYRGLPPEMQEFFKEGITRIVTHEKSPIWDLAREEVRTVNKIYIDMDEARRQAEKMRAEGEHDGGETT